MPDANLAATVRAKLGLKPTAPITQRELGKLNHLHHVMVSDLTSPQAEACGFFSTLQHAEWRRISSVLYAEARGTSYTPKT